MEAYFREINVRLFLGDVVKALNQLPEKVIDLIFADPPYEMDGVNLIPNLIFKSDCLTEIGTLIVEHSERIDFSNHPNFVNFKNYGGVCFSFFE